MTDYKKECRAMAEQFHDDGTSVQYMYAALCDMAMSAHEEGAAVAFGIMGMAEAIRGNLWQCDHCHKPDDPNACCRGQNFIPSNPDGPWICWMCGIDENFVALEKAKKVTPAQYNNIACEVYPDPWLDEPLTEEEKEIVESRKLEDAAPWEEIKEKLKPLLKSLTEDYERIIHGDDHAAKVTRDQALAWAAEDRCDESVLAWGELDEYADYPSHILCPCGAFAKRTFDNYCSSRCRADALVIDRELTREEVLAEAEAFALEMGFDSFRALLRDVEAGLFKGSVVEMWAKKHKHLLGGGQ